MLRARLLANLAAMLVAAMCVQPFSLADESAEVVHETRQGRSRIALTRLAAEIVQAMESGKLDIDAWRMVFAVRVDAGTGDDVPAMLGEYRIEDGRVVFEPRFPLRPGLAYRVEFDTSRAPGAKLPAARLTKVLKIPAAPAGPPARVVAVYPSRDRLPENQLKFYIQFSAPMSRGEAYGRVHLLRRNGERVEDPFLELGEELWDPDGTRFTLFFDPGRIKRGLKPREEVGPSLEEGHSYTLVVDADWSDAAGRPLEGPYRKAFRVGPPDDSQPDAERWTITPPSAGTREPLVVLLDEPLDWAMLQRVIVVRDPQGNNLAGDVTTDRQETRWSFVPARNWAAGDYNLEVDAALEDLAGNSLERPFEVDVVRPVEREVVRKTITRGFAVRLPQSAPGAAF
jgi:hypothetical protein